ncbi:hypothetical protein RIF29_21105 [Crotalaria pallida]|uniref:Uncharacterized protein n=1 Tax=Crotalaria pallida TaxID=3830 RepID=A0AAN9F2H6_CROPI
MTTSLSTASVVFMTPLLSLLLIGKRLPVDVKGMVFSITQIVVAPIVADLLLNRYMNTLGNKKAELFDMGGGVGEPTAEEKEMHLKNSGFLLLFWFSAALVCCGGAGLPSGSEQ